MLTVVIRLIGLTVEGVLPRVDKDKRELLKTVQVKPIREILTVVIRLIGLTVVGVLPRVDKDKRELLKTVQVKPIREILTVVIRLIGLTVAGVLPRVDKNKRELLEIAGETNTKYINCCYATGWTNSGGCSTSGQQKQTRTIKNCPGQSSTRHVNCPVDCKGYWNEAKCPTSCPTPKQTVTSYWNTTQSPLHGGKTVITFSKN